MNAAERLVCYSSSWRWFTQRQLLPWVLSCHPLGDHLLEIGAGSGAATTFLCQRVARVTSLEYDHRSAVKLDAQRKGGPGWAIQGDASRLPFAEQAFSSALAVLVLHHLRSQKAQEQMLTEVFRVLRPGGIFLIFEITDGWLSRAMHHRSTFNPVLPSTAPARFAAAGFSQLAIDLRKGFFRLSAVRPKNRELEASSGFYGPTAAKNL